MEYSELVNYYMDLESTSKRLEMTDILVRLFKATPPALLDKVIYLTQGQIYPKYRGKQLGLAEKLVIKAVVMASGYSEREIEARYSALGDLGTAAGEFMGKKKQMALFSQRLMLERVYGNLVRIAGAEGKGSQDLKMKLLVDLLHDATPAEARYIVRTVLGQLRLGVADMTILDALALAFADKEKRAVIEEAYSKHPDLGEIGKALATHGIEAIKDFTITLSIPVKVMLAERLQSLEDIFAKMGGRCALDYKYDGIRIQAHISQERIILYSRQMDDLTSQFPEVADMLSDRFLRKEAIVEGECVPIDPDTGEMLPFQMVSHRRGRKYGVSEAIEDYPVALYLFDALYVDGKDLTPKPFPERRGELEKMFNFNGNLALSTLMVTDDLNEAERFFEQAINEGCEGVIAKSIAQDSVYRAGSRGFLWIKYKKDYRTEMTDSVDLVVVGGFWGKGRRAGKYGSLLMATYNTDSGQFETVCKMASGFNDDFLEALPAMLEPYKRKEKSERVVSEMEADMWFEPGLVLEVVGAEVTHSPIHTCGFGVLKKDAGLAIRFPRFTGRVRDDKGPEDATTTAEMIEMYTSQLKKV